jgi:hypothetical protein
VFSRLSIGDVCAVIRLPECKSWPWTTNEAEILVEKWNDGDYGFLSAVERFNAVQLEPLMHMGPQSIFVNQVSDDSEVRERSFYIEA